jgi:subfamily B ATP-binding cassette protein MsbA
MHTDKWYGVKFLIPYLKKYKTRIIFTFISMIGVAVTSALAVYIMKPILNNIFVEKDEQMLTFIPLAIIALFMLWGMFRFFSIYLATSIGDEITQSIHSQMFFRAIYADIENMIQSSLEEIMKQKTTIVIAHRLSTIKNADKVIVVSEGEIVEVGSYDEVSKTDAFKKNFALKEK